MAVQKMNVISADVGSSSVRVAITHFSAEHCGKVLVTVCKDITIHSSSSDIYEQNTKEIWRQLCSCIKECLRITQMDYRSISGIAFTATCSLVVVGHTESENDVIMWMDHRSINEARAITNSNFKFLENFGSVCSPEFSISKLMWLHNNQFDRFSKAKAFMELPDWLVWRSTQSMQTAENNCHLFPRSSCCIGCKWAFDTETSSWSTDIFHFLSSQNVSDVKRKIGEISCAPGTFVANLSSEAAIEMGLLSTDNNDISTVPVAVSSSLIDAHSGVLAMLTLHANINHFEEDPYESVVCMIAGTSTCHMVLNRDKQITRGVWGPYFNVIFPEYYLREAGQSSAGKLIEFLVKDHYEFKSAFKNLSFDEVIKHLNSKVKENRNLKKLNTMHIIPSFHGNRSPFANALLKGGIYGLDLKSTDLVTLYEATIEALAYETKLIIESMRLPQLKTILMCGGLARNEAYLQIHADVLNCEVIAMRVGDCDMMLVGSAILAKQAALKSHLSFANLSQIKYSELQKQRVLPDLSFQKYHTTKYNCYKELMTAAQRVECLMKDINT